MAPATERDAADIDWIVSAPWHDIKDNFPSYNNEECAASILRLFESEQHAWVVEKYEDFQVAC